MRRPVRRVRGSAALLVRAAAVVAATVLGAAPSAADELEVVVGGLVRLEHYWLAEDRSSADDRSRLTALSQIRAGAGDTWTAYLELIGHLRVDPDGAAVAPDELTLGDADDLVRQAYLSLRLGAFDVDLGKKFVTWGKVDFASPLDVVNHFDGDLLALTDPLHGPRADPLLHVTAYPSDDLSVELVYVPFLAPNLLPFEELELDFRLGALAVDAALRYPKTAPFAEWAHSLHGAVSWSTFLLDLQVTYSWFRDQMPDLDLSRLQERIGARHEIEGVVVPAYHRAHNVGLGASLDLGGWVISADAGAKFLEQNLDGTRIDIKNPELRSALQVDRLFAVGQQPLTATAGVAHRLVLYDRSAWRSPYSEFLTNFIGTEADRRLHLQHEPSTWYLLSRLQTSLLRERLSAETTAVWGVSEQALHLAPRLSYAITDSWSVAGGANLWLMLDGPDSARTGLLRRDDAKDNVFFRATLRY